MYKERVNFFVFQLLKRATFLEARENVQYVGQTNRQPPEFAVRRLQIKTKGNTKARKFSILTFTNANKNLNAVL